MQTGGEWRLIEGLHKMVERGWMKSVEYFFDHHLSDTIFSPCALKCEVQTDGWSFIPHIPYAFLPQESLGGNRPDMNVSIRLKLERKAECMDMLEVPFRPITF